MTSTRWLLRRQVEQAAGNIKLAQEYIVKVGAMYESGYPAEFQKCCIVVALLEDVKKVVEQLRESL